MQHISRGSFFSLRPQVGRKTSSSPPTFELQPAQYAKIKLAEWTYTSSERQKVITLARKAFDELKLPPDSEERVELARKEAEAVRSKSSSPTSTNSGSLPSRAGAALAHSLPAKTGNAASAANSRNHSPVSRTASPAASIKKKKPANGKKEGGENKAPVSKKEHKEKSVFSKQLDKFRAEKRAASLPNGKAENGVASPRLASSTVSNPAKQATVPARKDRSTSGEKEKNPKQSVKRRSSRDYSSSEEDSDAEPAPPAKATKMKAGTLVTAPSKKRPSPDDYSSSEEEQPRGRPSKRPTPPSSHSKAPAHTPVKSNGHTSTSPSSTKSALPKSPDDMRERYEELFPAYQLLTKKLVGVYQDCEDVEVEDDLNVTKAEVAKMAQRWQKWHNELEGIRQWFENAHA